MFLLVIRHPNAEKYFIAMVDKPPLLTVHTAPETSILSLTLSPIGFIRNNMVSKFAAPHQPNQKSSDRAVIELLPDHNFHRALEDLEGFSHIWLIFWFHRNLNWTPKVRPPRGGGKKRGVFATRSPYRPNPIGISAVSLVEICGLNVSVGACDLVDGTPILDIKPYIPAVDSFPQSKIGWLQSIEDAFSEPPAFTVSMSKRAAQQLASLDDLGIRAVHRASELLARDPSPHRTRRIRKLQGGTSLMACAKLRIFFSLDNQDVLIEDILET